MSFVCLILLAAVVAAVVLLQRRVARLDRDQAQVSARLRLTQGRVQELEQELAALCSASVGAGEHLMRLELQVRRIAERQNGLEVRVAAARRCAQPTPAVHEGALIQQVMDACGLSRAEAELLVMKAGGSA